MPQINLSGTASSGNVPPIPTFASSGSVSGTLIGGDMPSSTNIALTTDTVDLRKHPSGIVPVLQYDAFISSLAQC